MSVNTGTKKLHIKTWGCQMNVYDSDRMADTLRPMGYTVTDDAAAADLVILNTCHIREKASEKLFSELGRLNSAKPANQILAVAGCVAQAEGKEIMRREPGVSMVFGPQTYHLLPEMLAKATNNERVVNTDFPLESKFDLLPTDQAVSGPSAYLSVQEGCDKFCTYCVVPYTRGAEYSRSADKILAEARQLAHKGVRDITLLGQNVNAYHGAGTSGSTWNLARLIREIADIDGVARIRYTTSHPQDMDDDLIEAHGSVPALMPFLHLPVQSGSDKILAAMNRKHTADAFYRVTDKLRALRPGMAFVSDFIVGFPGETDDDFAATMDLVRRTGLAQAYSFKFSRRPGTPAATMPGQVTEAIKQERLEALQALLFEQQTAFNHSKVGEVVDVLFDKPGRHAGQIMGRSPWLQSVYVTGPLSALNQILPVRITGATQNSINGELVSNEGQKAA